MDLESAGKLIVVDSTGGGKSLITFMSAVTVAGISLLIIPLLSLTANQLSHIKKAVSKYRIVTAHHLNDLSSTDLNDSIIPMMDAFPYESLSTMLLLCSPQFIIEHPAFKDALIRAYLRRLLRRVVLDEAQIYAQHGCSLRTLIRIFQ